MHSLLPLLLLPLALSYPLSLTGLCVSEAPSSPRPYILPHYENSHAVTIGSQLYRFSVTGPSSDYAFTLLGTNAPSSPSLGVPPHLHHTQYEYMFNFKGRFQLWIDPFNHTSEQHARLLTQGDFGSIPLDTTHTFQFLDPDTEMVGVIVPGGFEQLFYSIGKNYTPETNTLYDPSSTTTTTTTTAPPVTNLQSYDVFAQPSFTPRRDLLNDSAPPTTGWHTTPSSPSLPPPPTNHTSSPITTAPNTSTPNSEPTSSSSPSPQPQISPSRPSPSVVNAATPRPQPGGRSPAPLRWKY
ncbi:RmlC-like cupin [Aspergillus ellipticus CBS 707.79]|uniref:RmlC-like cupin n=1 Tax=Aspergillus ellipticus CBS 707.79 TaxID=1448320 RepID=A0A319D7A0_9EURO|nr:RmlC-like cupin [Aspergillus ellipticus CBS 707.79]